MSSFDNGHVYSITAWPSETRQRNDDSSGGTCKNSGQTPSYSLSGLSQFAWRQCSDGDIIIAHCYECGWSKTTILADVSGSHLSALEGIYDEYIPTHP